MRKIVNYALIISFFVFINISAFAGIYCNPGGPRDCPGGGAGAPLDGGLLAILAGAGITYFVARKKRKNKDKE